MSPILGIWASARKGAPATSYESIATVTVGSGGASDVEFTSIPGTYSHLQIRYIGRLTGSTNDTDTFHLQFNSDTSSVYADHILAGYGSAAFAGGAANKAFIAQQYVAGGGLTASSFGAGVIDILDYANSNKFKTTRTLMGVSSNATTDINYAGISSGLWRSTNAITSIKITPRVNNLAEYSHFALYGCKSA